MDETTSKDAVAQNYPDGTVVRFKHESDVDGEPVGPCDVHSPGQDTSRVYDPNAERTPWVTLSEATARANRLNLPLREI